MDGAMCVSTWNTEADAGALPMHLHPSFPRAGAVLWSVALIVYGVGWASAVLAQSPAKTWKTIDDLSVQELQTLDLSTTAPRDAQIPYLPAEAYPFSLPYTAEELAYLAFDLDAPRPRFSHIWLSVVQRMTAEGHILATLKNNTAILYRSADGGALMCLPAGQEYMRGLLQFTNPPALDGRQSLWMEYRTDQAFTKKQDHYNYTPERRRIRRQPQPRRESRFLNGAETFDDLQGRDPWEFSWKLIGTDVLYDTIRFPNTRPTMTLTRPDGSSYDQDTSQIKMMGEGYPAYRSDGGVKTYVVEAVPRPEWLPDYYCGKLLYWIDTEVFYPLRVEQYDRDGNLLLISERLARQEYPEDGRLGYTPLIFLFWRTDLDLLTAGVHDYHQKRDWLSDRETYFSPEFLRRGWLVSPYKTYADVSRPDQFYLRPRLYPDKFPDHRPIQLTPLVAARVAAQERAGHLVFEVDDQPSAGPPTGGSR